MHNFHFPHKRLRILHHYPNHINYGTSERVVKLEHEPFEKFFLKKPMYLAVFSDKTSHPSTAAKFEPGREKRARSRKDTASA